MTTLSDILAANAFDMVGQFEDFADFIIVIAVVLIGLFKGLGNWIAERIKAKNAEREKNLTGPAGTTSPTGPPVRQRSAGGSRQPTQPTPPRRQPAPPRRRQAAQPQAQSGQGQSGQQSRPAPRRRVARPVEIEQAEVLDAIPVEETNVPLARRHIEVSGNILHPSTESPLDISDDIEHPATEAAHAYRAARTNNFDKPDRMEWRRAIVLNEILSPPMAMRDADHDII